MFSRTAISSFILLPTIASNHALIFLLALSVITGFVMIVLFGYLSDQKAVRVAKDQLRAQLLAVRLFQDQPQVVVRAYGRILTGTGRYLKERNPAVRIVGAQPAEGSRIPGIRKWPPEYLPKIYDPSRIDETVSVSQADAEEMARRLAREEGLFGGISAAGACWVALQVARTVENATLVFVVCDRGDRYLSTGVFPA